MKTVKVLLYILCLFLFQELVFRYCFPVPEIQNFDRINFSYLYFDGRGSKHTRDQNRSWQSEPDTSHVFVHEMNMYGFRDEEWKVEKTKKRALFIGDSFVEGVMSTQGQTIPSAFAHASQDAFETLNGGLIGCGLNAYLQLSADMIPVFKPDVAFLCIYANDLGKSEPIVPAYFLEPEYFSFFKPRLLEVFSQIKTYGPLNFRWNTSVKPYLHPVPSETNPWTKDTKELSKHTSSSFAIMMQKATFNPFLVNSLVKEERYLKSDPKLGETIGFFKYVCEQQGTKPVVVYIPSRNQVSDYYLKYEREFNTQSQSLNSDKYRVHQRVLKAQCDYLKVDFIDCTGLIKANEDQGNHLYWNYDQHMRAKGYLLLGEYLWDEVNH